MDLKPINNNETITFNNTSTFKKSLIKKSKTIKDPSGSIPNGIYGAIRWEVIRQIIILVLTICLLIFSISVAILNKLVWKSVISLYIFSLFLGLISLFKFSITVIENSEIRKGLYRYKEDLCVGITSTPPFIAKLYINLYKKQIAHNWITFITIFFVGIFTLLLWWLKDVDWSIMHFKTWIYQGIGNPALITGILSFFLFKVAIIHIIFTIHRKKRISDINLFFGMELASESEIEKIKSTRNKAFRRSFIMFMFIIFVVPIVFWIIYKLIKKR